MRSEKRESRWIIYDVFEITHHSVAESAVKHLTKNKNKKHKKIIQEYKSERKSSKIICVHNPNNKINDAYARRPHIQMLHKLNLV